MTNGRSPEWLLTTVSAVRELMIRRLEADSLDVESKREIEMALEELDVMWEELQGQTVLLVRENERYAEFFQYAPDAYLISDTGGNIREANEAALELLKTPRDEVVGRAVSSTSRRSSGATKIVRQERSARGSRSRRARRRLRNCARCSSATSTVSGLPRR